MAIHVLHDTLLAGTAERWLTDVLPMFWLVLNIPELHDMATATSLFVQLEAGLVDQWQAADASADCRNRFVSEGCGQQFS